MSSERGVSSCSRANHAYCVYGILEDLFWKSNNMITNNQVNDVDEDDVVKATTDSICLIHILEEED